jgi:hypothetical protein
MHKTIIRGVAPLLILAFLVFAPAATAAGGGSCTLHATASLSPGLGATPGPFSFSFVGTVSGCQGTSPGTPPSGTVQAGIDGAPRATGTGSCLSNMTSGYSINRWSDGETTVVKFTAVGALAAVELRGTVVGELTNGTTTFRTTEPTTPLGSIVSGTMVFATSDPLACLPGASGVSTATIDGQLAHADGPAAADGTPAGIEGCVVSGDAASPTLAGLAVHRRQCSYTATRRAGYAASGSDWSVTLTRAVGTVTTTTTYSSSNGAAHVCDAVIAPGDVVTVTAGSGSVAAAGNPVPSATDFLPTATGKCAG